ncbi:hypothetical protein B2J93_3916 [Marssonina coronariae]|uniref:protein-tyrosine-phosphatase n=1 Tax=Diplocarpon coronariae TaxID=2795749 RepID=A0A218YZC9_9HELO|nr:hypothetical protein B2J93_3916 [Marssonina coronariae]
MATTPEPISVLFVCLGNICRSTMAEGIFRSIVSKPPYQSLISVIHASDFSKFDFIFAMDRQNLRDLQQVRPRGGDKARVMLFGEFSGKKGAEEVDDPYYGARDGFEVAYEQCSRFSRNFLKETFPDVEA